jgi:hypothetical protein
MNIHEQPVSLEAPCCGRKVRPVSFMAAGVHVVKRTCPKCRLRWQAVVKPLGWLNMLGIERGGFVHEVTWAQCRRKEG